MCLLSIFDSVINRFLINKCQYDPLTAEVIAISPETRWVQRVTKIPEKLIWIINL